MLVVGCEWIWFPFFFGLDIFEDSSQPTMRGLFLCVCYEDFIQVYLCRSRIRRSNINTSVLSFEDCLLSIASLFRTASLFKGQVLTALPEKSYINVPRRWSWHLEHSWHSWVDKHSTAGFWELKIQPVPMYCHLLGVDTHLLRLLNPWVSLSATRPHPLFRKVPGQKDKDPGVKSAGTCWNPPKGWHHLMISEIFTEDLWSHYGRFERPGFHPKMSPGKDPTVLMASKTSETELDGNLNRWTEHLIPLNQAHHSTDWNSRQLIGAPGFSSRTARLFVAE